jgi:hypothetical protein
MLGHGRRDVVGRGLPPSCTVNNFQLKNKLFLPTNSFKKISHKTFVAIFGEKNLSCFWKKIVKAGNRKNMG